jgi:PA14 domain-containing protein
MKSVFYAVAVSLGLVVASVASAQTLKLTPASPQPSGLKSGLSVQYAWGGAPPARINNLAQARSLLSTKGKPGKPLRGLDYRDTAEGDPVMTFNESFNVAADIQGYLRFDAPGTYELETWSNDGIEAQLAGQPIGQFMGRQSCRANQRVTVQVPQAGWYALNIVYFQKYGTSCLMMKWAKEGQDMAWVPNNVFGRK